MCSVRGKNSLNTPTAMFGQMLEYAFISTFVIAGLRYTAIIAEVFLYCYVQKFQFLIIIFVLYRILYLWVLTIKNIKK